MQIRCPLVQETFSASDGFTRMIERHRILDVAGTRKSGVQCPQSQTPSAPLEYETCRAVTLAAMVLRRQRPLLSASGDIFRRHTCMPRKMMTPSPGVSILSENGLNPLPTPSEAILLSINRFEDCASVRRASRMQTASVPRSAWQVSTRSSPKKCDLPEPRPPYTPLYLAGARSDSKTPAVGIFRIDNGTTYSMRKQARCPQWTRKQSDDRDISKSDTTRAATAAPYRRRPVSARNNQCSGSSSW